MSLKEAINPLTIYISAFSQSVLCFCACFKSSISHFERAENHKARNGCGDYLGTTGSVTCLLSLTEKSSFFLLQFISSRTTTVLQHVESLCFDVTWKGINADNKLRLKAKIPVDMNWNNFGKNIYSMFKGLLCYSRMLKYFLKLWTL